MAKIHIAKKDLGLDDEAYRGIIKQATDNKKESSSKCTDKQLLRVLDVFANKGWKNNIQLSKKFRRAPSDLTKKVYALWGHLQNLGEVDTREKKALDKFVEKRVGISSVQFLGPREAVKVIEMLKKWIERRENAGK